MEQEVRLVDANKLKNHYAWWENGTAEMTLAEAKKNFDVIIDVQPTVDAEPVVRCKDCKWWKTLYFWEGHEHKICVRESHESLRKAEDFCSWGERKEDADN